MKKNSEPGLVKVSVVQSLVKRYNREYNVSRHIELLEKEALDEKPHFICIPNYFFQTGSEKIPGPSTLEISRISKRYDLYIIGGMAESCKQDRTYNSAFVAQPDGTIAVLQRKIHIIAMERGKIHGGFEMNSFDTPYGKIGCVLCNDIFYPEVARCIALDGAEIIFAPSVIGGLGIRGLECMARARAIENQVYFVNANAIPYEAARVNPDIEAGKSGIYTPFLNKTDLVRADCEESIIRGILDMDELREIKRTMDLKAFDHNQLAEGRSFNMLAGRRPEIYRFLTETAEKTKNRCNE